MIVLWIALIVAGAIVFAALGGRLLKVPRTVEPTALDEREVERSTYPNGNVRRLPVNEEGSD